MDSSVFHFCVGFVLVTLFAATSRGQSVVDVNPGQTIPNNVTIANGTTVNVNGGTIGLGVNLTSGTLNINSGEVAIGAASIFSGFENTNNIVNVTGGEVGGFFQLRGGTELSLTGGMLTSFGVFTGSTAILTGGSVSRFPDVFNTGTVSISGGEVFSIRAFDGATVNLFGSNFALNGIPINGLMPGEAFTIANRNVTLTTTLVDGSILETDLDTSFGSFSGPNPDGAASNATITATLVLPGDFDFDSDVDGSDFLAFQRGDNPFLPQTAAALTVFEDNFGNNFGSLQSLSVPEPTSAAICLLAGMTMLITPCRRQKLSSTGIIL